MPHDFLNIHVLFTTSVANPNRDDTGAPKQVTYGGRNRSRISSQAMTRAKRMRFELESGGDQLTYRAKTDAMVRRALAYAVDHAELAGQPVTAEESAAITEDLSARIDALFKNPRNNDTRASAKGSSRRKTPTASETDETTEPVDADTADGTGDGKKDTLVWLAESELRRIAVQALTVARNAGMDAGPVIAESRTGSLSIAGFGRMFAAMPHLQNEAAIQRSHAFTTHTADIEPDYFTAVNDLPETHDGRGAGHLAINQFTGGVYYWHANIDRRQLWATLIPDLDEQQTRDRLTDLVWALFLGLPSGKQNTTAYQTLPDAVLTVAASAPVALHQAFERPVQAGHNGAGYREPSLTALLNTQARLTAFTPSLFGEQHLATILDIDIPEAGPRRHTSLDDVAASTVDWILTGRPTNAQR